MKLDEFLSEKIKAKKEREIKATREYKDYPWKDKYLSVRIKITSDDRKKEYGHMIRLLNFVFQNIPYERETPVDYDWQYSEEFKQRKKIGEEKLLAVKNRAHSDFCKCTLLFYYVLIMYAKGYYHTVTELIKELTTLYTQFAKNLPSYNYSFTSEDIDQIESTNSDIDISPKRKTNDNKSDCLEKLYFSVFKIEKCNKVGDSECNQENHIRHTEESSEAYVTSKNAIVEFLLKNIQENNMPRSCVIFEDFIIESLMTHKKYSDISEGLSELQKICNFESILTLNREYQNMRGEFIKRKNEVINSYNRNPFGSECIFEDLNNDEVKLLDYLYSLHKKYSSKALPEYRDITDINEQQQWTILTSYERELLANYVFNLSNDEKTLSKYIRNCYIFRAQSALISLCAYILDDPYYFAYKQAEEILSLCRHAPHLIKKSDKKGQEIYSRLKANLDKTYTICLELEHHYDKRLYEKGITKIEKLKSKKLSCDEENTTQSDSKSET